MRKLTVIFIGTALFLTQHVYANECGLPKRPAGRATPPITVHCADCVSVYDFAFYGAGSLHKSQRDRIWVVGSQGSKVSVTTDRPMVAGLSFRGIGIPDFSRMLVTAHDLNGKATGDAISDMVFPSHVLAAKCAMLEEEAQQRMDYAESLWERYSAAVQSDLGTGRGWRGIPWARSSGSRIIPRDDCSNCRSEEIEVHQR